MEKSTQPACPELAENNDRNPSTRSGRERSSALQVGNTTRKFPLVLFVFIGIYIALLMVAYDRLLGARTVKLNQQNPAMEGNTTAHEMAYIALSATILAARALSNDTSNRYFLDELNTFEQQAEIRELVYASETIRYEAMHPSWSVEHVTPFESSVMKTMIRLAKQERKNRIMNQEATAFYYPGVFLLGSPKTSSTLMWKVVHDICAARRV